MGRAPTGTVDLGEVPGTGGLARAAAPTRRCGQLKLGWRWGEVGRRSMRAAIYRGKVGRRSMRAAIYIPNRELVLEFVLDRIEFDFFLI
jgi:hypothetical protein